MLAIFGRKYINLLALIAVGGLTFLSYVSYLQLNRLTAANAWVIHTHEVIETMQDVVTSLYHAESGQHDYLLTKNKTYLNQYNVGIQNAYFGVNKLQNLTKDNKRQEARIAQFAVLLKKRIDVMNDVLKINQEKGIAASIKRMKEGGGKRLSDQISVQIIKIINNEEKLLLIRDAAAVHRTLQIMSIELIGNALSLLLILICIMILNRQLIYRVRDSEKLRKSEGELLRLAYYDQLTGLPNRILFIKNLDDALLRQQPEKSVAVLLLDLDHFKNINDLFGQEMAEELLQAFAGHLQRLLRLEDSISRIGGDEFAVVLTDVKAIEEVKAVAQKILTSLKKPIELGQYKIFLTVSIGISFYPQNGLDAKTLMINADNAMYQAKEMGKNNYQLCTQEMTAAVEEQALLDYHLHQALDNHELVLLYQPIMGLKDNRLSGVEVLMRWNSKKEGLIFPENFISLAESNGLIVPMGEWMLQTACRQMKQWQQQGLPLNSMSINISARQLIISDFVASVKKILLETALDPHWLELEITETVFMENSTHNIAAIRALKNMGIKITIDDFGTKFSSLNYLRQFSADKLKIDKIFVQEIQQANTNYGIVNAIIVMAHSLGISVVAEGVETAIQLEYLKAHGCDEIQGYFYSTPLRALDLSTFILST